MHVLDVYETTCLIPEQTPTDIGWIGNASTLYGLGVIVAGRWVCLQLKDKWGLYTDHKKDISWMETAAIRVGLVMLLLLGAQPGRTYFVDTDNKTTEAAIKKRCSRNAAVNEEWRQIQDMLFVHQINIRSRRVPSKENRANWLSRGDSGGMVPGREIRLGTLPADLAEVFTQV
jgi:predicted RNA-binding protein YlxR (DUF448 family)